MPRACLAALWLLAGSALAVGPARGAPPDEMRLPAQVISLLQREFPHPDRLEPLRLLRGALEQAEAAVPSLIYRIDADAQVLSLRAEGRRAEFDLSGLRGTGQVLRLLDALGVFAGGPPAGGDPFPVLFSRGMLRSLDSHSTLLGPEFTGEGRQEAGEPRGGVGLTVARRQRLLTIAAVAPRSPADRAGLRPGARILQIGARATLALSRQGAEALLRGVAGSPVSLLVWQGPGSRPAWVRLKRIRPGAGGVSGRLMAGADGPPVAYLRIGAFTSTTAETTRGLLERYRQRRETLAGIVLDLRGNPGGGLEEGIHLADLFLDRGTIVTLKGRAPQAGTVKARWYRTVSSLPLVVLVDRRTASAAEMVAGALKANRRAWVMGEPTFGKTAVQSIFPLHGGHVAKLTVANFSTRRGDARGKQDVIPHVVLVPVRIDGERGSTRGLRPPPARPAGSALPLLVLPYLEDVRGEDAAADYALRLSLRVLRFNRPVNPAGLFRTAPLFIQQERQRQERALVERLRRKGIDWSFGNGGAQGQVTLQRMEAFVQEDAGQSWRPLRRGVRAGQWLRFNLTLHNPGRLTRHRVLGVVGQGGVFPEGLEIPVGRLLAGQSRQAVVRLRLPGRLPEGHERFEMRMLGTRGEVLARSRHSLPLAAASAAAPRLTVSVYEDGRAGSRGNGDGNLQAGETASVSLRLHHPRRGPMRRLLVWIGGLDPRRADLSRAWSLLPVKPGKGDRRARLHLSLSPRPSALPAGLTLNLVGALEGGGYGVWSFPVPLSPLPRGLTLQPPRIRLEGPPRRHGARLRLRGEVVGGREVKRLLVYLNGKKVDHLRASRTGARRLPFVVDTRLGPGRNRLRLVATDGQGLAGRRELQLWPEGAEPPSLARSGP